VNGWHQNWQYVTNHGLYDKEIAFVVSYIIYTANGILAVSLGKVGQPQGLARIACYGRFELSCFLIPIPKYVEWLNGDFGLLLGSIARKSR
jgi:hypothetical protein